MPGLARRPRIAIVATRAVPSIGGIETHVSEIAPRLASAGAEVTVLTTDPGWGLPHVDRIDGANLRRFRAWPATRDFSVAPGLYRSIARGAWDLVHCQGYQSMTGPLAMASAAAAHIPFVVTLHSGGHSSKFRNRLMPLQWNAMRPLLARARLLVAVSEFEAQLFSSRLALARDRFVVIPNGSDIPPAGRSQRTPAAPLIASIGRLEHYKGHHLVLGAFPRVLERFPKARLRIAGSGPEMRGLVRTAARLGISDRVTVEPVPSTDRAAMAALLSEASLVVLLSDYEAQGIAAYEALSIGAPLLVTYSSALRDLADRSLAAAVPPGASGDEIAAAIIREVAQPRARAPVQLATWDECASRLYAAYQAILRWPTYEEAKPAHRPLIAHPASESHDGGES